MKLYRKYLLSKSTDFYNKHENKKQKIVVALAADYGNLGDVAITYAQTKFLEQSFPEAEIIDFPISKTFTHMKSLKKVIKSTDIITIVGGGNTGDMYDDIEFCRQFVIKQFPNNKIIGFPQTIDFSESKYGQKALNKAIRTYSKHKKLVLSAREKKSLATYKRYFKKNNLFFSPDIVLSLDQTYPSYERENITFCLRSDNEKRIDSKTQEKIVDELGKRYTINFQDTHIDKNKMSTRKRKEELNKVWTVFKKSKLVITDRLHGMIFCAITNTPCIAIDNSNHKVSGVYNEWLKDNDTIDVIDKTDIGKFLTLVEEKLTKRNIKVHKEEKYIEKWKNIIKG